MALIVALWQGGYWVLGVAVIGLLICATLTKGKAHDDGKRATYRGDGPYAGWWG